MALSLKLRYEISGSNKILIFDDTGAYALSSNPGGWGGANEAISTATALSIVVKKPDATTLQLSSNSLTVNVYNTLPSLNGIPYTILNTDLGLGATDTIPDGVYEFDATLTTYTGTYTYNTKKVFYYNAFKCKEDKKKKIDISCPDLCKGTLEDVLIMELGFDGITYNVESGDITSAVKILKTINSMCCCC